MLHVLNEEITLLLLQETSWCNTSEMFEKSRAVNDFPPVLKKKLNWDVEIKQGSSPSFLFWKLLVWKYTLIPEPTFCCFMFMRLQVQLNLFNWLRWKPIYKIYTWVYMWIYNNIYYLFIYLAQPRSGTTKVLECWLVVACLFLKNKANVYKFAKYQIYVSLLNWHNLKLGYKEEMKIEEVVSETES